MKYRIDNHGELIIREGGFTPRIWAALMLPFASAALIFIISDQKTASKEIPLIMLSAFIVASGAILFFVKYEVRYFFSISQDLAVFTTPRFMGVAKVEETFKISDIVEIAPVFWDTLAESVGRVYTAEGFQITLKTSRTVNGNYSSSDHKEIEAVVEAIRNYTGK